MPKVFRCCIVFILCLCVSSRRRHTRCSRDWSSDVCSSDLARISPGSRGGGCCDSAQLPKIATRDRKSVVEGKRVDLGGRRIIKKKNKGAARRGPGRRQRPGPRASRSEIDRRA